MRREPAEVLVGRIVIRGADSMRYAQRFAVAKWLMSEGQRLLGGFGSPEYGKVYTARLLGVYDNALQPWSRIEGATIIDMGKSRRPA